MKQVERRAGRPLSFDRDVALERAMHAFWQSGYETTSISDLTAAMGVTAPSIYAAFGDKKQLFLQAMRLYAGSPEALQHSLDAAPTARAAVEHMLVSACYAFTGDTTPKGCLLASATASGSHQAVEVRQAVAAIREQIVNQLRDRIDRDVRDGVIPSDTDCHALALMVVALIQGMSVLARDGMARARLLDMVKVSLAVWPD